MNKNLSKEAVREKKVKQNPSGIIAHLYPRNSDHEVTNIRPPFLNKSIVGL